MLDLASLRLAFLQTLSQQPIHTEESFWQDLSRQVLSSTSALKGWSRSSSNSSYKLLEVQTLLHLCIVAYKLRLWNTDSADNLIIDTAPLREMWPNWKKQLSFTEKTKVFLDSNAAFDLMMSDSEAHQDALFSILGREVQHHLQPVKTPAPAKVLWSEQEEDYE